MVVGGGRGAGGYSNTDKGTLLICLYPACPHGHSQHTPSMNPHIFSLPQPTAHIIFSFLSHTPNRRRTLHASLVIVKGGLLKSA
jgi:hypothetical protein